IQATKNSNIPYLAYVIFKENFSEALPLGLKRGLSRDQLDQILGQRKIPPISPDSAYWRLDLDLEREIRLHWHKNAADKDSVSLHVVDAVGLGRGAAREVIGLFVTWAATKDCIDETALTTQQLDLLKKIRRKESFGDELFEADFFWDSCIKDEPGLRSY